MRKSLLIAVLLLTSLAWAENFMVMGSGEKKALALHASDTVQIAGNQNAVTVTGEGDAIQVMGNGNTVTVDAAVKTVYLHGNENKLVLVNKEGRKPPAVKNRGKGNSIK